MCDGNTIVFSPGWLRFSCAPLPGAYWICDLPEKWQAFAGELVMQWGFSLEELLDFRMSEPASGLDCPNFAPLGEERPEGANSTLREWSERAGIALIAPELAGLAVDPRVGLWREMLQTRLEEMRIAPEHSSLKICHEEIAESTGYALTDDAFGLIRAALRPFRQEAEFDVYSYGCAWHAGVPQKGRYFMIVRRALPLRAASVNAR